MIYAVSPLAQKKEVDEYCFDTCGKILVAGVEICEAPFFICRQDNCPYEDKLSPVMGDLDGEEVKVRKLKEVR